MSATSKRPWPLLQPISTSDPTAIRANDWTAFRQLERVEDHWTLKQWEPGRSGYYWYLTFDQPGLIELARRCQGHLARADVDPVPEDGFHLTMLSVGRPEDVSAQQLAAIVAAARRALADVQPFDLEVGPLSGSRSALRFSVTPWDDLLAVHRVLREATATVRDRVSLAETVEFRPHLGIGYLNTSQPAAPLIEQVSGLRDLTPATVTVDAVRLVELRRDGRCYRWTDHAVVPLAA